MKGKKNFAQTVKQFFNKKLYLYNVLKKKNKNKKTSETIINNIILH